MSEIYSDDDELTTVKNVILNSVEEDEELNNKLASHLTRSVIIDWTAALSKVSQGTTVSRETNAKLQQIYQLYHEWEDDLSELAERIGVQDYYNLAPSEVLFMVFLRDIQEKLNDDLSHNPNIDQIKLGLILDEKISVRQPEDSGLAIPNDLREHPVGARLIGRDSSTVYRYSGTPEYWYTVFERRALCFDQDRKDDWKNFEEGDVIFFYSTGISEIEDIKDNNHGYIGCGVLGRKTKKSESWFWDEHKDRKYNREFVISFRQLHVLGNNINIDFRLPIWEKETSDISRNIDIIQNNAISPDNVTVDAKADEASSSNELTKASMGEALSGRALLSVMLPDLNEVSPVAIHQPFEGELSPDILDDLYFPDDRGREIIQQVEATLRSGKNIIFTGPPGTGKTVIAEKIVEYLGQNYPHLYTGHRVTTATADWSTFDTMGGYMPSVDGKKARPNEHMTLEFSPGLVLTCLKAEATKRNRNSLLVIDELNRADIDKAFGQLFTVLTDQSVDLPFTQNGKQIQVRKYSDNDYSSVMGLSEYIVPLSWSLFGTMNTYDKTSLYEISYAFMRRFSFIPVEAPKIPEDRNDRTDLVRTYVEHWEGVSPNDEMIQQVGDIWFAMNTTIEGRNIGPAIIKDILQYVSSHSTLQEDSERTSEHIQERFTEAVISYVFPQLEGVQDRSKIVEQVASLNAINRRRLVSSAKEMLSPIDLSEFEDSNPNG